MSFLVGLLAALAATTVTTVLGKIVGINTAYLAGWWGCMAFYAGQRWFERRYSRRAA